RVLLAEEQRVRRNLRVHTGPVETDIGAERAFGPQLRPANVVRDAPPAAPRPPAEHPREHVTADIGAQPPDLRRGGLRHSVLILQLKPHHAGVLCCPCKGSRSAAPMAGGWS